jgi:hypothetical protein
MGPGGPLFRTRAGLPAELLRAKAAEPPYG